MQSHLHKLKCWPEPFQAVRFGLKTVEVRKADRPFKTGDYLQLDEWNPETRQYTGKHCSVVVTHMLDGGQFGLEVGYVAMSCHLDRIPLGIEPIDT